MIAILYPSFGVITNIVLKEDNAYRVKIGDIPLCTYPDFMKLSSHALGNKGEQLYCVFKFVCKVNYDNNKFIHAPTYIYNKNMCLLELVGINEC